METPNTGSRPLEVVVLYAFDSASTPAYDLVDQVFWSVQDKIGWIASSSRINYIEFSASHNEYTFLKRLARSRVDLIERQSRTCTKNMACGLPEADRLIRECKDDPNGIILLFSDGLMHKGDFFDGAEDFPSTWPVHTFTVGGDEFNKGLRAIAANSPGGTFNPLPVPDSPRTSVVFSQYIDDILGIMKDDEKPPTTRDAAEGINARTGLVTMNKLTYSKNDVALMTADTLTVGVELIAASTATAREWLDLVVVVDIQGSWAGGAIKLSKMKKAMEYVIMKLTPMDRLSIVSKSSKVHGLRQCPLLCMTPSGKAQLKDVISSLNGSCVNLQDGLMEALAVIGGRCHTEGRAANVFFLTDDKEGRGNALALDPGNVAVHTFGFDNCAGHQLLNDIAKRSRGGTYSFVPEHSDLCVPFSQILGGLLTIVAQDVVLTLTSKGRDVDTMEVSPGVGYKHTTNINSRGEKEITISFGTIFSGESRKVRVNFSLNPSKNSKVSFDAIIAEVQHTYDAQQGVERQPSHSVQIRRAQKPTGVPSIDAVKLHAEEIRCQHADTIRDAVARAETKKLEEAKSILEDGLDDVEYIMLDDGDKMLVVLREELQQLIKHMETMELYEDLGRPYALATMISHDLQRAVTKGDADPAAGCLYVTPRMIANLKQAKQFEKDPTTQLPSADDDLKVEIAANPLAAVAGPLAFHLDNGIQSLLAIKKILVATI